jgi:hypothetical protein
MAIFFDPKPERTHPEEKHELTRFNPTNSWVDHVPTIFYTNPKGLNPKKNTS